MFTHMAGLIYNSAEARSNFPELGREKGAVACSTRDIKCLIFAAPCNVSVSVYRLIEYKL